MTYKEIAAKRLKTLPPYLFAELDRTKERIQQQSKQKIIDLGEGNPDIMPDTEIIKEFAKALRISENHRYPSYAGKISARIAVAKWYKKRFNVDLNPETEVAMLIGTKEGIAHLFWAMIDKGDIAYVPSPAYPIYNNQTKLAGGIVKIIPLLEKNNFLPDLDQIKPHRRLKLLCLNYPNNPTTAVAPFSFYKELIDKALKYNFYVFNDNVYSELYYNKPPHSILEVPNAKQCAVEFHSLSKTFSMCGWRIGFVVGNKDIIASLIKIKQNVDSGPFGAIQDTAVFALNNIEEYASKIRQTYEKRLSLLTSLLNKINWKCRMPDATFYLWLKIPLTDFKNNSLAFSQYLLEKTGVLVAPGRSFGYYGEGYIRLAAIVNLNKIKQVAKLLGNIIR